MTTTADIPLASPSGDLPARAPRPEAPAQFIVDAVGDVARPRAGFRPTARLGDLPGQAGFFDGLRNIKGWLTRGNAHLVEQQKRFGPIYQTRFGLDTIVCVSDPDVFTAIARNEDRAWSSALAWGVFFEGINPSSPTLDTPVNLDFEPHAEARKLLQPAFSPSAMTGYLEAASPRFEEAVERWVKSGTVRFKTDIRRLLATVSSSIFTGIDDEAEGRMLDRALAAFWKAPFAFMKNPWLSLTWRKAMRGHETLRDALEPKVAERRARGGSDLFSRLCDASRGADWLDDAGLVRLFIGVMAAAFDTTSLALTSMVYLLAKHPEWQERLREEARSVSSGRVSYEASKRLVDTERVWKETLRLFPVAADIPRVALRDVDILGHRVPAGTFVLAMMGPILQDPSIWTDPLRFDPERFSEARAEDKKNKGAFLPFGGGAHACIGMHLANVEAKVFCHTLLTRCRFHLEEDYVGHHVYTPLGVVSGDVKLRVERIPSR
jgi:cytochrome P450